jgi:hypothetical protein
MRVNEQTALVGDRVVLVPYRLFLSQLNEGQPLTDGLFLNLDLNMSLSVSDFDV